MAFDTIVNKAQLELAMTASANAIRSKTGDTNSVEWTLDNGFADAILAIQTTSSGGIKFATGSITFNSNYSVSSGNGTEIQHNLGIVPDAVIIRSSSVLSDVIYLQHYFGTKKNGIFNPDGKLPSSLQCTGAASGYSNMGVISTSTNDITSSSGSCVKNANTTSFYFAPSSNMAAKSGQEYVWYVIGKVN